MTADWIELDWLKRWKRYAPLSVALQSGEDGRTFTYKDLYDKSQNLAEVLQRQFKIGRGDRVACLAQNELESVALFFAVQRLGAILVPINFRFTVEEVKHIVADSTPKLLIAQDPYAQEIKSLKDQVEIWNFDSLCQASLCASETEKEISADFEDVVMILYTSGTTGFPKGAMISNRMIFWNSVNTGLRLNLSQSDCVLTFLPLFHTGGWNVLTTPCLHRGAKVVLLKKFDPDLILDLCESEKVSVLFGVPTTMALLQASKKFLNTSFESLRYAIVGGEPMPLKLIHQWQEKGVPIRQGYGLTEFGPNVFSLNEEDSVRKMGSIGFPNFYIEAKVVNSRGEPCHHDQIGELILRGPVMMSGYWNNPAATNELIQQGWLYTGDLVRQDADGYFFVVGRKKEMFISGGENVYPAEVERVIRSVTGVSDVAVIGVKHDKWGECGRAFVVRDKAAGLSIENLKAHCENHLAKFKVPQEFLFLENLPKTESGKIAKNKLKELV